MQKPLTGTILGILTGLAIAVFLARQGIWPADRLTVFFLPGILGLLGLLLLSMGRPSKGPGTLALALLLAVPITLWGALGFADLNQTGEMNGGCQVYAQSSVDDTIVTDTTSGDPFVIDPDGSLHWEASSPTVFQDYQWKLEIFVGDIPITVDSGTEANAAGDQDNDGDIPDIGAYASSRGINLDLYRGVYKVGGSAATCDGFGFVEIPGEGMDTIALIALITAITLLIVLLVLTFYRRGTATSEAGTDVVDVEGGGDAGTDTTPTAAGIATGAAAAGVDDGDDGAGGETISEPPSDSGEGPDPAGSADGSDD